MSEKLDLDALERAAWNQSMLHVDDCVSLIARIRELESGIDSLASTLANVDKAVRETLGIDLDADDALPELVAGWMEERAQHAGEAEPVAWMTPSDWAKEPLATCSKSVANAWRYDNRRITPLYAAPQPAALPEGWQPVPDLMTREMMRAWFETDPGPALATGGLSYFQPRYAAMLAAAPQPREWDASDTTTAGER